MIEPQSLTDWLRGAGRVTVIDEGLQAQLFAPEPTRMYRLYRSDGECRLIDAETANAYGLRPTAPKPTTKPQQSESLFDTQEGMF